MLIKKIDQKINKERASWPLYAYTLFIAIASFLPLATIGPKSFKLINLPVITLLVWGSSLVGIIAEKRGLPKIRVAMGGLILSLVLLILLVLILIKLNLFHFFKFAHPLLSALLPDWLLKFVFNIIGGHIDLHIIPFFLLVSGSSSMVVMGIDEIERGTKQKKEGIDISLSEVQPKVKIRHVDVPVLMFVLSLFSLCLGSVLPIVKTISSQTEATINLASMSWAFTFVCMATTCGIVGTLWNKKWDAYHTFFLLTGIYLSTFIYLILYKKDLLLVPIPNALAFIYPNSLLKMISSVGGEQIFLPWFTWVSLFASTFFLYKFNCSIKKLSKLLIDDLTKQCHDGNTVAQYYLGAAFLKKIDVNDFPTYKRPLNVLLFKILLKLPCDERAGLRWLRLASGSGHNKAKSKLYQYLIDGCIERANSGDRDAQFILGLAYLNDFEWDNMKIEKELRQALYAFPYDVDIALKWLKKANLNHHPKASMKIKEAYLAKLKYNAKSGDSNAQYALGMAHMKQIHNTSSVKYETELYEALSALPFSYDDSMHWLRMAESQKHIEARVALRELYLYRLRNINIYNETSFYNDAYEYIKELADHGNADATFFTHYRYFTGIGIKRDFNAAMSILLKSSQANHIISQIYASAYLLSEDSANIEENLQKSLSIVHKFEKIPQSVDLYETFIKAFLSNTNKSLKAYSENQITNKFEKYAIKNVTKDIISNNDKVLLFYDDTLLNSGEAGLAIGRNYVAHYVSSLFIKNSFFKNIHWDGFSKVFVDRNKIKFREYSDEINLSECTHGQRKVLAQLLYTLHILNSLQSPH